MAAPKHAITIGVKGSATLSAGEFVKVTNLTSGGTLRGAADSTGEVILNIPPDFDFTWANGDVCSVEIAGRVLGSVQATINKGGIQVTVTATTAKADAQAAVDL